MPYILLINAITFAGYQFTFGSREKKIMRSPARAPDRVRRRRVYQGERAPETATNYRDTTNTIAIRPFGEGMPSTCHRSFESFKHKRNRQGKIFF